MSTVTPQVDGSYITVKLTPNQAFMLHRVAAVMRETYAEYLDESLGSPMTGADANSLTIAIERLADGLVRHQSEYGA